MYCADNGRLFFWAYEDGLQNVYTLTPRGEVELILKDVSRFLQDECGTIFLKAGDNFYVIRTGKLIELEVKTME